jgi:hypothetical protein
VNVECVNFQDLSSAISLEINNFNVSIMQQTEPFTAKHNLSFCTKEKLFDQAVEILFTTKLLILISL